MLAPEDRSCEGLVRGFAVGNWLVGRHRWSLHNEFVVGCIHLAILFDVLNHLMVRKAGIVLRFFLQLHA